MKMLNDVVEVIQNFDGEQQLQIIINVLGVIGEIVVYLVIAVLLLRFVKKGVRRLLKNRFTSNGNAISSRREDTLISILNNIATYVIWGFTIINIISALGVADIGTILAGVGVLGVGISFGAQDLVKDVIAGIFIMFEDHFSVGDVIEADGFMGEVIQLGLKTTRIQSWTGEIKIIANGQIGSVKNYSINKSVSVVDVGVSYDANLLEVEKVVTDNLKSWEEKYDSIIETPQYLGVQELGDSCVVVRIIAATKPMHHVGVTRQLNKDVKMLFDAHNIEIPFPQLVLHGGISNE